MPGALDAFFGLIFNRGVAVDQGGGIDFVNGGASYNKTRDVVEIRSPTLGGKATLSGAEQSAAVVFTTEHSTDDYEVHLTPQSVTGGPASGANRPSIITDKTEAGFTFHTEAAPGGGATITYAWMVVDGDNS